MKLLSLVLGILLSIEATGLSATELDARRSASRQGEKFDVYVSVREYGQLRWNQPIRDVTLAVSGTSISARVNEKGEARITLPARKSKYTIIATRDGWNFLPDEAVVSSTGSVLFVGKRTNR